MKSLLLTPLFVLLVLRDTAKNRLSRKVRA